MEVLSVGDIIQINGYVMMNGLDDGKRYIVVAKDNYPAYTFRVRGGKRRVRHRADLIHASLNSNNDNRIVVVR